MKFGLGILIATLLLGSVQCLAQDQVALDWTRLRQAVTLYIPNPQGAAVSIRVEQVDVNVVCQGPQSMLIRLTDPEGNVLHREELPDDGITAGAYQQAWAGWDHELWAQGGLRAVGAQPLFDQGRLFHHHRLASLPRRTVEVSVPAGQSGVLRLLLAGCDDHAVRVTLTPHRGIGVVGHPDFLVLRPGQPRYVYVSERADAVKPADALDVWLIEHAYPTTAAVRVMHGDQALSFLDEVDQSERTTLTPRQALGRYKLKSAMPAPGSVLRLESGGDRPFLLRVSGLPAILCDDEATARLIAGGARRLPDGPVVQHAFQQALWESVASWQASDLELAVKPGEWYKPDRATLTSLKALAWERTHDPAQVDRSLKAIADLLAKSQPFDLHQFMAALPLRQSQVADLAFFYLMPLQGNALHGNEAIRNLITLAMVREWLNFRTGDVIYAPHELNLAYIQGFHWNWWETLWYMKESLPAPTLRAFQRGAEQIADRLAFANALELVLTNGRTTIPLNLHHASLICDEPRLVEQSRAYLHRIIHATDGDHAGQSISGYFREHFGPDGGYCTYPLYQLGRLHAISGDKAVLDAMDRLCQWIAHVTFPQGNKLVGPTSWNARINMSAGEHVWGDGYKFIASQSPWAARLYRRHPNTAKLLNVPDPAMTAKRPDKATLLLTPYTREVRPESDLPCESTRPGITDIGGGGEFFAINRGSYYALVYAGERPPFWMDQFLGGAMGFTGGAITGLYVRGAGPVLLGRQNKEYGWPLDQWQHMASPAAVGTLSDGRVFHTGVSRCVPTLDDRAWTLRTVGQSINAPVNFERHYQFNERDIEARITVASADLHQDVFQYQLHFNPPTAFIREAWEVLPLWNLPGATIKAYDQAGAEVTLEAQIARPIKAVALHTDQGVALRVELERVCEAKLAQGKLSAVYLLIARDLPPVQARASLAYKLTPAVGTK